MATKKVTPLIVIMGETGSGKSALALKLAKKFNGEIICADSRTVYRGMDIGTAKPSHKDREQVPHHLLDITTPDRPITVAEFKGLANAAITDISGRGKLPILVGGSGLYIDSVIFDFGFQPSLPAQRAKLARLKVAELQELILQRALPMPVNFQNPRHLQRTLETNGRVGSKKPLRRNTLLIGLKLSREDLQKRIKARIDTMFDQGLIDEAQRLVAIYSPDIEAFKAPGYQALRRFFAGELGIEEVKQEFIRLDLVLAKRQRTWFKRNNSIQWVEKQIGAVDLTTTFLNKQDGYVEP